MYYPRLLDLSQDLASRSVFLFGPRQTGKTTYLLAVYPESPYVNLLKGEVFLRFSRDPGALRQHLASSTATGPVIIDEIQKLPRLLDEVHDEIERTGRRFILTGSSAVKLRRGGVNLLGGRARTRYLHPLVSAEVPDWSLTRAAAWGGIPSIYLSRDPAEDLRAYCGSYLQLEIQAESVVRGVERFSRFLHAAARSACEQVNFERIASDASVAPRTVREYFAVLQDTLVAYLLEPHGKRGGRKPVAHAKLYFFDVGVANALAERFPTAPDSESFGKALEHLVFCELKAYLRYRRDERPLAFWRSSGGREVDFVVGDEVAIEVKASRSLAGRELAGLRLLGEELKPRARLVVCQEPLARRTDDGVLVLPAEEFFRRLWQGEIL